MQPYYQDKLITLYRGDCLDVMPMLEAQSFDAVITDVPYGTTACAWDSPIPFAPMWACLKRLARPRAAIVLFGSQPFTSALVMSNLEWFKYTWVWEKDTNSNFFQVAHQPLKRHEDILVFSGARTSHGTGEAMIYMPQTGEAKYKGVRSAGVPRSWEGRMKPDYKQNRAYADVSYPLSILRFASDRPKIHPTQKPLPLLEYLIRTYTNEGDTVLDFTSGSGTTLRACKNLKRRAVGIEMLEHYCEVTVKRLEPAFEAALVDNGAALDDLPLFATETL